jgi:hypothetical protein
VPPSESGTAPPRITYERAGRARLGRRLFLGAVGLFVMLGLFNFFGSRTATASATANGYNLRVSFPAATRSSLPIKWEVVVTHPGGFSGPVRIAVPISYFNLFDFNNFYPLPDSTLNEGGLVIMAFPRPAGDRLDVLLDARTQAGLKAGQDTTTAVVDDHNRTLVEVGYSTMVVP